MNPFCVNHNVTIYHCDCRELLPQLSNNSYLLTDPPYGLSIGKQKWHGNNGRTRIVGEQEWDHQTCESIIASYVERCENSIVWGGNFYPLPPSRCWLVWDKLQPNRGAECELAWTNLDRPPAVFRMSRIDAYFNKAIFKKTHPTEKPIQLAEWAITHSRWDKSSTLIDPFMGSGFTLSAAKRMGWTGPIIGCDMELSWCELAAERLS